MAAPMSIRLDDETRRTIARLARARRRSQSEVVREAIDALLERAPAARRPWDSWREVVGIARSSSGTLSEHTGRKFAELLAARKRRRVCCRSIAVTCPASGS